MLLMSLNSKQKDDILFYHESSLNILKFADNHRIQRATKHRYVSASRQRKSPKYIQQSQPKEVSRKPQLLFVSVI